MHAFLPDGHSGAWLTVFTLETILYAVGTAFIVHVMVKDHHVHVCRIAASTDHLTRALNRRAFIETGQTLCKRRAKRDEPVAVRRAKAPRNGPDSSPQRDEHVRLAWRHLRVFRAATNPCGRAGHIRPFPN